MSKSSDYWEERFKQIEESSNAYGQETYRQIEPAFDQAQRQIQGEIEAWYGRFATNNNISMHEARRLLNSKELEELKWDVDEYIKYGRENALNEKWIKELENASCRFHVSRLEALKIRTQQAAEVAFGNELDAIDKMARRVFTEDYYQSIYEIQKGFNIGWDVARIDERKLNTLISKPWAADGKNFSQRIWQQRSQLVNELHNQLTRACILGKAPDEAINEIARKFKTTKHQASRLVMTEQAYFHSAAQKEAFNELDVEEYEIVATLDSHTSQICREMDGKHFPMSDYKEGVTAPPFHVFCRSVTVPWFEDNFNGQRAARGEDGKTYYVPDSMTYEEWRKTMLAENNEEFSWLGNKIGGKYKKIYDDATRMTPPVSLLELEGKYVEEFKEILNQLEPKFKHLIIKNSDKIKFAKINAKGIGRTTSNGIYVNLSTDIFNEKGSWTTSLHEIGHAIDRIYKRPSHNVSFKNAIISDFTSFKKVYMLSSNVSESNIYIVLSEELCKASKRESHILSDLFGALTNNQCVGESKHSNDYWEKKYSLEQEAFAHFFSVSALGYDDKISVLKGVFPNAYSEFMKIIGDL